jgi:ribose transport system substrate-binding protein
MRTWRRCLAVAFAALAACVIAACGSSSDNSSSSAGTTAAGAGANASTSTAAASSGGGASCIPPPPTNMPKDPDGVVAGLTGAAKAGMGGYPGTVYKSPWIDFKSKHGPPYKIGMSNNEGNLNAQDLLRGLKQAQKDNPGKVSQIISTTPSTPNDVATQIQQMRSLLQQHVDIIFSTLGSPTALNGVIDAAAKQGVPVISILGQSTSKNAVNLQPNPIQLGYYGAKGMAAAMGGKGNILKVAGIPGLSINTDILKGGDIVIKACHLKVVGNLVGKFDPALAKSEVLKFFAGHPGQIDGVFQVAGMAPGIFSAFQQVGRKVPPVGDIAGNAASLAFWRDNMSKGYKGSGSAIPPQKIGIYTMDLGLGMLEGRGVKVTDVPFAPPEITDANLNQWVKPEWTTSTNALADGPDDAVPIKELLDTYLSKPAS